MHAKRAVAATELLLILPASLFMTALFVRDLEPAQLEPARSARRLVEWFSRSPHIGLHVFLMAMPLLALLVGCGTVRGRWRDEPELRRAAAEALLLVRAHLAILLVAAATLAAAVILAIVALHALTS